MNHTAETRFKVTGMKCGGCIARAREALARLPGFIEAQFDLAEKAAVVKGRVDPQAVIQALRAVGYPAEVDDG